MARKSHLLNFLLMVAFITTQQGVRGDGKTGMASPANAALTFLVYIAADNNLATYVEQDLVEMERIGSTQHLNILVYLNTKKDDRKITQRMKIEKNNRMLICEENGRDSGDPQTLVDACAWAHTDFPSDQFVLVLWDHGTGAVRKKQAPSQLWHRAEESIVSPRAVCFDDTTNNYLTEEDLVSALDIVCNEYRDGKKIDIIAFDACLMACIEVAYCIAPYSNFMVASQQTISGKGFGYHYVLENPARVPISSTDMARCMVSAYSKEYGRRSKNYTLSAIDLSHVSVLENSIREVSKYLTELLEDTAEASAMRRLIHECKSSKNCVRFSNRTYLDIAEFYKNLIAALSRYELNDNIKKNRLIKLLKTVLIEIENCVIANVHGSVYVQTCGLSTYFRRKRISSSYKNLSWVKQTNWLSVLKAYDRA